MLIGYARVSTQDQTLNLQRDALEQIGCKKIFTDTASGAKGERKGLEEALAYIRDEDTPIVRLSTLSKTEHFIHRNQPLVLHPSDHYTCNMGLFSCPGCTTRLLVRIIVPRRCISSLEKRSSSCPTVENTRLRPSRCLRSCKRAMTRAAKSVPSASLSWGLSRT